MPCRCEGYDAQDARVVEELVDELTQNLCFACGVIEERGLWKSLDNPRLQAWWANHQIDDCKRVGMKMGEFLRDRPDYDALAITAHFVAEAKKVHPVSRWHKNWFFTIATSIKKGAEKKAKEEAAIEASISKKLTLVEKNYIKQHGG